MKMSRPWFGLLVCVATAGLSAISALLVFRGAASTSDEIAQLWHAKMLVHGFLSLPVDPNREFFSLETVVDDGRWYSQFPIGGPLMAIPGAMTGHPWLTNAVLAGASAFAMYWFARHVYGEGQGRAIALLFSITPMILGMAGTWMNHVPVLFLATCTLAVLTEWDSAATVRRRLTAAGAIGCLLGFMATIRPLDAVVVSLVIGIFQLWTIARSRERILDLVVQALVGLVAISPLLFANRATTGNPFRFGYEVQWGTNHNIGFHADPYGVPHTLERGLDFAMTYISELNFYFLAWPIPALAVVVVGLLAMRRVTRWDVLLLGFFFAQVAAYSAYWYDGEFLGPRFLYTALPALVVFVARTPFLLIDRFGVRARNAVIGAIASCLLVAWGVPTLPYNVWGLARQARSARSTLKEDVGEAVERAGIHNALVFVREPFSSRLSRRMWGLGLSRWETAQLTASRNPCLLFLAVRAAEARHDRGQTSLRPKALAFLADSIANTDQRLAVISPNRPAFVASVMAPCQADLADDGRFGNAAFGPALLREPIDKDGRIDGDVIYVADLGERNQLLRTRFGDRVWYRLLTARTSNDGIQARVVAY
jgi:hypothetical protein